MFGKNSKQISIDKKIYEFFHILKLFNEIIFDLHTSNPNQSISFKDTNKFCCNQCKSKKIMIAFETTVDSLFSGRIYVDCKQCNFSSIY